MKWVVVVYGRKLDRRYFISILKRTDPAAEQRVGVRSRHEEEKRQRWLTPCSLRLLRPRIVFGSSVQAVKS